MRNRADRLSRAVLLAAGALVVFLAVAPYAAAFPQDTSRFDNARSISEAQGDLVNLGYLKTGSYANGRIDDRTAGAIRNFQWDHRLPVSGDLDPDTVAMLTSHPGPRVIAGSRSTAADTRTGRSSGGRAGQSGATAGSSREMPATSSRVPLVAGVGGLLAAVGFALWRGSRA